MVARLYGDFRSGNLNEELGILLLKQIASVAEIARPEDVGVDAMANLLRYDQDGNYYAEDGFLVQLKSSSVPFVTYEGHGLQWLTRQTQPMFIGVVSPDCVSIALYSTIRINQAMLALPYTFKVKALFQVAPLNSFPWTGDPDSAVVYLGDPVATWDFKCIRDQSFSSLVYDVLKKFLAVANKELELLRFRQCSEIKWVCNEKDSIKATFNLGTSHPKDFVAIAAECVPALRSLLLHASSFNEEGVELTVPLLMIASELKKVGIEVDKDDVMALFFAAKLARKEIPDVADDSAKKQESV